MKKMHKNGLINFPEKEDEQLWGIYPVLKLPWEKAKEDYWSDIESKIDGYKKSYHFRLTTWLAVAASIAIIIAGTWIFAGNISEDFQTAHGDRQVITLPDGSEITLNAGSELSYKKYTWWAKREVRFEGEAFFNVEKGKKFTVVSKNGTTGVMGTSFNIYSRNNAYRVTCVTGKVYVEKSGEELAILSPEQKFVASDDRVEIIRNIDPVKELSWMNNSFAFNNVPLKEVFEEIERQFNVKIDFNGDRNKMYSGVFPKMAIEDVLTTVCRPFGYRYEMVSKNEFLVNNNNY